MIATPQKLENLYMPDHIRVRSGIYVNVMDPKPDMITIEDIAHALAHQCRFSGHLPKFYSVAQHSVLCSEYVTFKRDKLAALLHDASEAYLVDIARPVKNNLSNYKEIEDKFMHVIAAKFGFKWPMSKPVMEADNALLEMEWQSLMLEQNESFVCQSPNVAKEIFLETFKELTV